MTRYVKINRTVVNGKHSSCGPKVSGYVLGNISIFDPYFGWLNLMVTLRLGFYHDQLHYEDVLKQAATMKGLI